MRALVIIVADPFSDDISGMVEIAEQGFVQTFIAESPVERFAESVLRRLSWRDVMPLEVCILRPCEHGVARQFRAVVGNNHLRPSSLVDDAIEFANDAAP